MIGETFGRLTVTGQAETRNRNSRWHCVCQCGNTRIVYGFALRSGGTRSCGCLQREWARTGGPRMLDIAGRRYGRLTAIERASRTHWLCQCDCGNTATVQTNKLTSNSTKSCGCLRGRLPYTTYNTLHKRLSARLGPASRQACVDCGQLAAHWSYDHRDPGELIDERGLAYSLSAAHYAARCVPCHREHDLTKNSSRNNARGNQLIHGRNQQP